MAFWIIVIGLFIVLVLDVIIYSCCVVSGQCSRIEEEREGNQCQKRLKVNRSKP